MVLVLDEDLGADQFVQARVLVERRGAEVRRDAVSRLVDVGEGRCLHAPSVLSGVSAVAKRPICFDDGLGQA